MGKNGINNLVNMKKLLIILLTLLLHNAFATTYYISNSGSTSNNGTSTSTSWPFSKVNSTTFSPGDNILFNRGETFYGSITVSNSGTAGNPITFGAYGTGAKPIITGFTSVTAWTNLGGNIWESTNAISTFSTLNMVVVNGVNTPMGRIPNTGFYTYQTHNANVSITSSSLTGTPNWAGAQAVIKKEAWLFHRAIITSQSGGTINYTDEFSDSYSPRNGWGFFIQNDIRTLDTTNEWYYNPTTKKISIYSATQPTGVKIASQKIIINTNQRKYITLDNLNISGADSIAVYLFGATNGIVQNCDIGHAGYDGINVQWSDSYILTNNTIRCCGDCGINNYTQNTNATITWNVIDSTSMIDGINRQYGSAAIYSAGKPSLVQYNSIDHSGYNGILVGVDSTQIKNNFINNSCLKRTDGGGIYCGGSYTFVLLDGNIIFNSYGNLNGMISNGSGAQGIYMDAACTNVTASNNTCAFNHQHGIYVDAGSNHNSIINNTSYNNVVTQFEIEDYSGTGAINNILVTGNKFISKIASQLCMKFQSSSNSIPSFFSTMDNNYHARPIDDNITINAIQPSTSGGGMTLAQWQTFSGFDAHSRKSPKVITDTSQLRFEYNASTSSKIVPLGSNYIDAIGNRYNGSITLAPYSSAVLILSPAKLFKYNGKLLKYNGKLLTH
jgi:predicted outer membrane repeat protein